MEKLTDNSASTCPYCGGIGVTMVRRGAGTIRRRMFLPHRKKGDSTPAESRIPQRYTHCSLESLTLAFAEPIHPSAWP